MSTLANCPFCGSESTKADNEMVTCTGCSAMADAGDWGRLDSAQVDAWLAARGEVRVPVEPTEEMAYQGGCYSMIHPNRAKTAYRAMIKAAKGE